MEILIRVIAVAGTIAMLYAVIWCVYDVVVRAHEIGPIRRFIWVLALLGFNVIAAAAYVWLGPGRHRWAALGTPR